MKLDIDISITITIDNSDGGLTESQRISMNARMVNLLLVHLFLPSSYKKQINKHNSYLLLPFLQSGSVPELDMHESKIFLPG
jgi:hypothetical protein